MTIQHYFCSTTNADKNNSIDKQGCERGVKNNDNINNDHNIQDRGKTLFRTMMQTNVTVKRVGANINASPQTQNKTRN